MGLTTFALSLLDKKLIKRVWRGFTTRYDKKWDNIPKA